MSSNTENTEAKLAAYIDGQLPDAERAQLDQFLAANPDLQKLLRDLIAQRALLRSLPRDRAPSDIYDTIQSQLERSVLLDDAGQSIAPPVRHSRRSQLFAIAAILLLSVGLGAVLYFALPSSKPTPVEVASTARPEPATTEEAVVTGRLAKPATDRLAFADAGPDSLPPAGLTLSNARPASPVAQALASAAGSTNADFRLQSTPPTQDRLVLLVSTTDPAKANQQVATYLTSNNITYESVTPPAAPQQAIFNRQSAATVELGKQPAPADQVPSTTRLVASRRAELTAELDKAAAEVKTESPFFVGAQSAAKDAAVRPYILARITRGQAAELTQTLSTDQPTQRARLVADTDLPKIETAPTPQTQPATIDPTLSLNQQPIATQPATLPATTAPTTLPTTQASDALDIVIVVEGQSPATAPTTAP